MAEQPLGILQVSASDNRGGAALIAWNLHQAYRHRNLQAWMAVGRRHSNSPEVFVVSNDAYRRHWAKFWLSVPNLFSPFADKLPGFGRLRNYLKWTGQLKRWRRIRLGYEDFDFPGTWRLLELPPRRPDIIHCHNLHGDYFDLRVLPWLSQQVPVLLTLHDAWLLSGHCAHSFKCKRWETGCGQCPNLSIYPAVRRDATAHNWRVKQKLYAQSRLYVATPCRWLMQKVENSMLIPAIGETKVIPHGVNLSLFCPVDKKVVRDHLGLRQDEKVLLFAANRIRHTTMKDYQTLRSAVQMVAKRPNGQKLVFIALGETGQAEQIGKTRISFVPYQNKPEVVAHYYQAADIYLHASHADTFPTTILEALACGTTVIATSVGGISEQVKSLEHCAKSPDCLSYQSDNATGLLVIPGDAEAMAQAIITLLTNDSLRSKLSGNAARDARERFDLNRLAEQYLQWYQEIRQQQKCKRPEMVSAG